VRNTGNDSWYRCMDQARPSSGTGDVGSSRTTSPFAIALITIFLEIDERPGTVRDLNLSSIDHRFATVCARASDVR
jgi:hypothetical protein